MWPKRRSSSFSRVEHGPLNMIYKIPIRLCRVLIYVTSVGGVASCIGCSSWDIYPTKFKVRCSISGKPVRDAQIVLGRPHYIRPFAFVGNPEAAERIADADGEAKLDVWILKGSTHAGLASVVVEGRDACSRLTEDGVETSADKRSRHIGLFALDRTTVEHGGKLSRGPGSSPAIKVYVEPVKNVEEEPNHD